MKAYYLDSSIALHILFGVTPQASRWFDRATAEHDTWVLSSRLLSTEVVRALRRESVPLAVRREVLDHVELLPLTDAVLAQAEAIVPHVKTLDAIHLASALASGLDPVVATHDAAMTSVAAELGLATFDPVTGAHP